MSETHAPTGSWPDAGQYEIRVDGHLEQRWASWFDGLTLTRQGDGTTVLCGPVVDQAALHGLLQKVRDLGLPLVSVRPTDVVAPAGPPASTDDVTNDVTNDTTATTGSTP